MILLFGLVQSSNADEYCGDYAYKIKTQIKDKYSTYLGATEFTPELKAIFINDAERIKNFYLSMEKKHAENIVASGSTGNNVRNSDCRDWILSLGDFSSTISVQASRLEKGKYNEDEDESIVMYFFNEYLEAVLDGYE